MITTWSLILLFLLALFLAIAIPLATIVILVRMFGSETTYEDELFLVEDEDWEEVNWSDQL